MSYVDYEKAQKLGLKAYKAATVKGENEYLPVLDEILKDVDIQGEVNLGLVTVPLDRIVGTSNMGRTYAFANNFMPILDYKTEFGAKWSSLCDSHMEEGIREPIKAFEYMNKFYVVEGNKRVSVLKYCGAVSVPAMVTRKIPKESDDPKVKIYYEFMEFYKLTDINYVWFEQEGCFKRLLELTCEDPTMPWTEEQKKDFGSFNHNFSVAFKSKGNKLPIGVGEAMLVFIDIYGYDEVKNLTHNELLEKISSLWDEFEMESKGRKIKLTLEPSKNSGKRKLKDYFVNPKPVLVAFIFDKDPKQSDWLYTHELGRLYLDEHCPNKVKTIKVHNLNSEEETVKAMEDLILMGVEMMFTTSSRQVAASMKIAANYPNVNILNCTLNSSYKLIRTYYSRLYEVKFLAGMVAGALCENGKIGYLADYPIIGMPANINAFALGASMVNPRAKVYLEWTTIKGVTRAEVIKEFKKQDIHYVSDQIMPAPTSNSKHYGLYTINEDDTTNIAMPVYNWGVFYEKIIDSYISGTYKEENAELKAINYWWGLSAGVVDILLSNKVPTATAELVNLVKKLIIDGSFSPFQGKIMNQKNVVKNDGTKAIEPEDIMKMNWLVNNIIGEIPEVEELKEDAKSIFEIMGVTDEEEDETIEDENIADS